MKKKISDIVHNQARKNGNIYSFIFDIIFNIKRSIRIFICYAIDYSTYQGIVVEKKYNIEKKWG